MRWSHRPLCFDHALGCAAASLDAAICDARRLLKGHAKTHIADFSTFRLASVRKVSEQVNFNINTVAKSYRDLALRGYLIAQRGRGVFIAEEAPVEG
jgi:DNA-binding transcriptional MocR family regulator